MALAFDDGGRRKLSGRPDDPLTKIIESDMCVIWLLADAQTPSTAVVQNFGQIDVAKLPDLQSQDSTGSPGKEAPKEFNKNRCLHPEGQKCLNCM